MPANVDSTLPELFRFNSGAPVRGPAQWPARRAEVLAITTSLVYGVLPPAPASLRCEILHDATVQRLHQARLLSCRVAIDGRHAFMLRVYVPSGDGPFPVVLNGDGCWHYATDAVIGEILRRAMVFAQFNRVEVSADVVGAHAPSHALPWFDGLSCGAIAAWAWAYQRAVDALCTLDFVDRQAIAVAGHSRGGKAALLAGAMDERIALTCANNSGAGGAGCFSWQPAGSESLSDITASFPHWFNQVLATYAGREKTLPFDQHFLKALVAPRALLTTEALGDLWANPQGSWYTHCAAKAVYDMLGAGPSLAIAFREGGHDHSLADWTVFLDCCNMVFRGGPRPDVLDTSPFA